MAEERTEPPPGGPGAGAGAEAAREAAALADPAALVERGNALLDGGRPSDALAFFERAVALAPDDLEARTRRLVALRLGNRSAEAVAAADDVLADTSDPAFVWNEKGKALYDLGRYPEAIEAFTQALGHDPANRFAGVWKSASLRVSGRREEALELTDRLLSEAADSTGLWNEKGLALCELRRYDEALAAFDRTLALDPINGFARNWKIFVLRALGDGRGIEETLERSLRAARQMLAEDASRLGVLQEEVSLLRALRRVEEAAERVAAALGEHPDDVFLINEAAALALDRGRRAEALELTGRALAIEPRNEFAGWLRLRVLRLERRFAELHEALDELPGELRDRPALLLERGWLAVQEGRPDDAEISFRAAVDAEPSPEAVQALATALERQGRYDDALARLEELLRARPDDLDLREQIGWFHLRRNRLDEAREIFRQITETDPDHLGGLNARGALAFFEERYEEATEAFRRVLGRDPWNPTWHTNLAWALARSDAARRGVLQGGGLLGWPRGPAPDPLDEAAGHCRRALGLDPLHPAAHSCLGVIAFKRGRPREAEQHFQRSLERDRLDGSLVDLGALWAEIGKVQQAEEILREALAANPDDAAARVEMGSLLLRLGRTEEAVRELRQAAAYAPEDPRPSRALALALIEGKRWHEGEEVLRGAIRRIEPHRAWSLHLALAHLLVQRGDESDADSQLYEEARRAVDEARRLRPDDPEVAFQAGVVWYRLEAYGRSLRNFRRCAELDPEQFEAVRNVERLRRLVRRARLQERGGAWASLLLVGISLLQLVAAWMLFLDARLGEGSLLTLASVSLGLLVVALLLPWLSRLKLPGGFEAQLSERTPAISPGPSGETSLAPESAPRSRAALSRGPS